MADNDKTETARPIETDWAEAGCSKSACRYEHSNEWGRCAYAVEPPPDTRCFRFKVIDAADGHKSIFREEVDHTEMLAEVRADERRKVAAEIREFSRRGLVAAPYARCELVALGKDPDGPEFDQLLSERAAARIARGEADSHD